MELLLMHYSVGLFCFDNTFVHISSLRAANWKCVKMIFVLFCWQYLVVMCSMVSSFSELILFNVHVEASGEWECVVTTGRGNISRSVEIVVLENSATFCPEDKVINNRGEFRLVTVTCQTKVSCKGLKPFCFLQEGPSCSL